MKRRLIFLSLILMLAACKESEEDKKFVKELTDNSGKNLRTEPIVNSAARTVSCYTDKIYLVDSTQNKVQTLFTFDSSLSQQDKLVVCDDIKGLNSIKLANTTPDDHTIAFDKIFANKTTDGRTDFLSYLYDRVAYLVSDPTRGTGNTNGSIVATNVGTAFWLEAIYSAQPHSFLINGSNIAVDSPRVGIVELNAYTSFPNSERMSTMVHEARHSDCENGFTENDYNQLKSTGNLSGSTCGHIHVKCPVGHEFAGQAACDAHAWGAYSVNAVFERKMYQGCSSCSQSEKQNYLMMSNDSFSRILVEADMVAGRLGDPKMGQ